ncbi:type ISP restriction/modification enzyme [Micromonospora sp. DSM 115977]|uniref:Type ISP restriction/modification enzyme n=1 Tax=Micromonospora reichwaldensis TaxID=3075516 RepID=A0ABU2X1Z8_9ACTN|nr:type ISP restriction/modification enzyme [Micromonospora sp. DSM 115977]MDT0531864.1 type ISP restriction/modification enzyme [Micromonospora sp. DSM 115977]
MPTTLQSILDDLYFSATSEADKGAKFERLMVAYLRTDPQYAEQFSQVWRWMEWPGRDGQADHGIDLVAQERDSGEVVAIQCKFYDPRSTIQKPDIDSFLSASGKFPYKRRMIISTTDRWGTNAEAAIRGQQIPVQRIRFKDLAESSIDWSQFSLATPEVLVLKDKKGLRQHQENAIKDVKAGFETHDRGKLIMACGTGKTFTSLRLAEQMVGTGRSALFLVPSIALLSQSLREWATESEVPLQAFAVCSDPKVSKVNLDNTSEDISSVDLPLPATTDSKLLHTKLASAPGDRMRVVFATYQSIGVVSAAQAAGGVDPFDLIICDEAHRTTGVTLAGEDESAFVRVHDPEYILGERRLYMTATPRIYDDNTKAKAGEADAIVTSMDGEEFGPEFHRLGFGEAVSKGLLTDYKVLVLGIDAGVVSRTFQAQLADDTLELRLDDVAKMVGCWNGLAKRGESGFGFGDDVAPMTRAVTFASSIKASKAFAETFQRITEHYIRSADFDREFTDEETGTPDRALRCEVRHVDGGMNALIRNEKLDWLREDAGTDTCRILSNARCLSEGVDVPALDAVIFLNPRKSQVDVVQSVGRVMRLAPDKKYGYIILPVAIPAGTPPDQALSGGRFDVIWQVLQALRAHDERFNAMINQIDLNRAPGERLEVIFPDHPTDDSDTSGETTSKRQYTQGMLDLPTVTQWRDAIYARIVAKVGSRRYWEDWAQDIREIAEAHITRIKTILDNPTPEIEKRFDAFLAGLRGNLNDSIGRDDAIEMLSQHLITKPVFDALFDGYDFTEHNPVSRTMQTMVDALDDQNLDSETKTLEAFYESVRVRAAGIDNTAGKQKIITDLYESFFKNAFPKMAESLGIVYTPVQVVDFILRSVEEVLHSEFGVSISDEGVHVLDPFTGTGTFIVRLLETGIIRPGDLLRKYSQELHANEILLLAYYIAAINIEATLHGLLKERDPSAGYVPFNGIVLADTFQMTEDDDKIDSVVFPTNNARAEAQKALDIRVIIGNPPYSVGQNSGNDNNANLKYPTLDNRIRTTYAADRNRGGGQSVFDSYIRAIRWASDRIGDEGVVGFVTNGGWVENNTADGLRKTLANEFSVIYVYNLRGNARTAGEQRRREKDNIFGQGARTTVAIILLVKKAGATGSAEVRYRDIGDYLTREDKLRIIEESRLDTVDWQSISPNTHGDWLGHRDEAFGLFAAIGDKRGSANGLTIFATYSRGLETGRDAWVYNYSNRNLMDNVRRTAAAYNAQVDAFKDFIIDHPGEKPRSLVDEFIDTDATKISWTNSLKNRLAARKPVSFSPEAARMALYRPFNKQHVYFDRALNHIVGQLPAIFPTPSHTNIGFYQVGSGSAVPFSVIMTDLLPDLHVTGAGSGGQYFPRWSYVELEGSADLLSMLDDNASDRYERVDNITDSALADYRSAYGASVSKDDIFFYTYGLLHSPEYRIRYSADLKKMLPRIPKVATSEDFHRFADAGRELAELHIGYEEVEPYPLTESADGKVTGSELYRMQKMRFAGTGKAKDRSTIIYNRYITLSGIPEEAYRYTVGTRSAVEWVMERYQVKSESASGITNDPNEWLKELGDPRYIVDLVKRVVTVSLETMKIVDSLPSLILKAG